MTNAEWAAALTPDQVLAIIHACLKDRDWPGLDCALKLLAVKDPDLAQATMDTMRLGVKLAEMTPEERQRAAQEAVNLGVTIATA